MTLQSKSPVMPTRLAARQSSFSELPVVAQLNCGYWVNATARVTPSAFICFSASSLNGSM